jgi:hypothetical protein
VHVQAARICIAIGASCALTDERILEDDLLAPRAQRVAASAHHRVVDLADLRECQVPRLQPQTHERARHTTFQLEARSVAHDPVGPKVQIRRARQDAPFT